MSNSGTFTGRQGFFGALKPYTGAYHPSVYRKYSRGGGSQNAIGTLGKAFAYKRPQLADGGHANDLGYAQGGEIMPRYNKPPHNNANNDHHQGHTMGRDGVSYSWGKVSPRFQNQGAEITPHGHNEVTPRKLAHGGGCSCWRCGGKFARGGQAKMTPPAQIRPFAVSKPRGGGLKIHAPHSGEGLVLNIHLGPVGQHAISFGHSGDYIGGVDSSRVVERAAMHRLAFPVAHVPAVNSMGQGLS